MEHQTTRPADWMEDTLEQNGDRLLRLAIAILGSTAEAEDTVQDVFVKLVEKCPDFESSEHETAWLTRVTINLCRDRLRSQWWKKRAPLLETYPARDEEETNVLESVSALPSRYRTVIHLLYFEGYTIREIAEISGQTESTVRKQHSRAKKMLREAIGSEAT